jgi:hypothetical protein
LDKETKGIEEKKMFENKNNNNNNIDSPTEPDAHERRRHARHPFTATVEAVEHNSKTRIQGRTSDLSRGGCYVDSTNSFPAGSVVKIRLTKELRSFEAQAEVVYSLVGMGMGVKFTDADPEQLWTVEKWVGELSGEMAPQPELPLPSNQTCPLGKLGNEENDVLNELVMELMKQGALSYAKGEAMLQKLDCIRNAKSDSAHA